MTHYEINPEGFYGRFGGSFLPAELQNCMEQLRRSYRDIISSPSFSQEFNLLLRDYVGRPSPLYLSPTLSRVHGCRLYLKREDLNHTGAHKINNAIGQILLAERLGKRRIIAETGAGQHGVATATVCALKGLPCTIYMGAVDVERQRPNVEKMRLLGAQVVPVPQGTATLNDAVNAAIADWCQHPDDTYYLLGSAVGPHPYPDLVARLQSVISSEISEQLQRVEGRTRPDYVVACIGGGSNAAGAMYHFLDHPNVRLVYAEAGGHGIETGASAATLLTGTEDVLHGSRTLVMHDAQGRVAEAYSLSSGLDYPGIGPLHAHLVSTGRAQAVAVNDDEALAAAYELFRMEGILPALESAHALGALHKLRFQPHDVVVLNLSGRGDKDMQTYLHYAPQGDVATDYATLLQGVRERMQHP